MTYPVMQVPANDTLPILFGTYDGGTGASITLTGLATTDIEIYKDGSNTTRASDSGYALLGTDGIDEFGTGIHGISIDLSDNTDAGFYAVGSWYHVVIASVTVDAQTVNFVAGMFRIMAAEDSAGVPDVNVTHFGGTAGTFAAGRPEVNTSHISGTAQTANDVGQDVNDILVDTADMQPKIDRLDTAIVLATGTMQAGSTSNTAVLALGAVTFNNEFQYGIIRVTGGTGAGQMARIWTTVAATDTVSIEPDWVTTPDGTSTYTVAWGAPVDVLTGEILDIADKVWEEAQADHVAAGSFGETATEIAAILVDTAEIGAAGAGLTAINLPDQTMNITGDITGNLSGSVGSNLELGPAEVNAEVLDVLNTDTFAEPGQETPGATVSLATKIGYLYKALRNRKQQTASEFRLFNDDAATVDHKATFSDDGTTADTGEMATGP